MTQRYLGGIITANPVEPSENFSDSVASGMWTMQEALSFSKAGDWPDPTSINPSKFVENIFSSFLYDGTGSSQTIASGIDLSGSGGLVWIKNRAATDSHVLTDTERGVGKVLSSNGTDAESTDADTTTAFNSNGFSLGADVKVNTSTEAYVSWSFRKQPKFFDIVTYTGTGSAGRTVSHNLGSVPGMIVIKKTNAVKDWAVYHRGKGKAFYALLNTTAAFADDAGDGRWHNTDPTATEFTLGNDSEVNANNDTYVAYLFAHNDGGGGFGSTGDQDIIKCGSYSGNGSTANNVTLGFEPQWILVKRADTTEDWTIYDALRGGMVAADVNAAYLEPHTSDAEAQHTNFMVATATGFMLNINDGRTNASGGTYIYVAIRRGLMKAPTAGTALLTMYDLDGVALNDVISSTAENGVAPFPPDMVLHRHSLGANYIITRLTGGIGPNLIRAKPRMWLAPHADTTEDTGNHGIYYKMYNNKFTISSNGADGGQTWIQSYQFRRQPKVFDVVTYTGTGSATTVNHGLGVTPELLIIKARNLQAEWVVYSSNDATDHLHLNSTDATADEVGFFNDTAPTSSVFTVGDANEVNGSYNYVAYLFATLADVSKVGTYTGTGAGLDVDCGFTNGARFVLVKRTDSTGDWYTWDSALNGIVSGNDPFSKLNLAGGNRTTNTDYIDPLSSGFTITGNAGNDLNADGGTYLFLAIA